REKVPIAHLASNAVAQAPQLDETVAQNLTDLLAGLPRGLALRHVARVLEDRVDLVRGHRAGAALALPLEAELKSIEPRALSALGGDPSAGQLRVRHRRGGGALQHRSKLAARDVVELLFPLEQLARPADDLGVAGEGAVDRVGA